MIRNGHAGFGRGVSEKDHNGTSPRPYLSRPSHANKRPTDTPRGQRQPRRDARRVRRLPGPRGRPGSKHGTTHAAMAGRHGPTPDPGRRSTVRRGATCARTSRGTPSAAPVWHAQADSAACRLVSTEAPDALRASRHYEARVSGTGRRFRLDTLTRRLLVELNNAEVGVSSSAASTGSSFRGKPGLRSDRSRPPDHRRRSRSRNWRGAGRLDL